MIDVFFFFSSRRRHTRSDRDWSSDVCSSDLLGEYWRELFGPEQHSFEHKGVHFVTVMRVQEKDFWTARGMTPAERMQTVAGLDNGVQSRFEVGEAGRAWLKRDLEKVDHKTPLVVFSHSPLYKYYRPWNFWTEDAEEVQAILKPFRHVTVIHGHTHQLLTNRIDNLQFHGCGDGAVDVLESGLVDKLYNLWDRNPVTVRASYLASGGKQAAPPRTKLPSY